MKSSQSSKKRSTTKGGANNKLIDRTPSGAGRRQPQKPLIRAGKQELAYRIPDCVGHYFSAMVDPFSTPAGACVPADLFPLPSNKVKTFARARMQLGTSGIGWAAAFATASNDVTFIQCTSAASVGTTATLFSAFTNVTTVTCGQLPYASATFTAGNALWRIVAQGIRVKYIGQLMDRNGVCIGYEDPDHQDYRRFSFDTLNSNPYTEVARVGSDEWDMAICSSGPVQPQELEFINSPNHITANGQTYLGIAVSGVAGDVYEVEVFQHIELIGQQVVGKTKSHAEPAMFGKVVEATKETASNKPLQPSQARGVWDRFKGLLKESLPALVETGAGLIGAAFTKQSNPLLTDGGTRLLGNFANEFLKPGDNRVRQSTATQRMIMQ